MINYKQNLTSVIKDIDEKRIIEDPYNIIRLIAVSKYSTSEDILSLYKEGQRSFGENKIQDLIKKQEKLIDFPIDWHFIGRLQKNKINQLLDAKVSLFHSLDSLELAQEIDKRLKVKNLKLNVLLQINSSYEDTKAGVNPDDAIDIFKSIQTKYTNINLKGIMSIGANSNDISKITKSFALTKNIFDKIRNNNINILSMGMSNDYSIAIENGTNMIRIGSKLFK